ncbi:formate dehydrogenase accessory protein FdhE [Xanthobacteraceae bacterium Astr-EGSB]|uniref:formate dehydrogenase accessory protein FdhE n=1 Tax=Astrobacterium formosum TaxID=3069710 RepID=UPI0027AFA173|nr:formate dehydrogenase accessory protein FdhE [Xanthobacteraceae bacterium Astr-EGSB]
MSQIGAPTHDPIPIGSISQAPFVRLPDPGTLFASRAKRLRALAPGHGLGAYLSFLADLSEVQHAIQDGLPAVELPTPDALVRAHEHAMPPIDRGRFTGDAAYDATWTRLLAAAEDIAMPEAARAALTRVREADAARQAGMVADVLADAVAVEAMAEHVFTAAALQVHFARLAAGLDAARLVAVGDGVCPCCGGPPVSSVVVGWIGAHGARFCACSLCGTLWNMVRITCTVCGSNKSIAYQEVEGSGGTVKAETCDACHAYVKVMHQTKDPSLDPVADDIASLALDLLVREAGYRRGAVNPFLLGY